MTLNYININLIYYNQLKIHCIYIYYYFILIYITPTKVPRLIGKKGSMINMIKDETKCDIIVGQNGVVWVKGEPEMERVAEKVINMIEDQAQTSGLTDRVRNMLYELLGKEIEEEKEDVDEEVPEPDIEE